jgi:hypothetical protein
MNIGRTHADGRWAGILICLSLGCSSGNAANPDGGADQSTQPISDASTVTDSTADDGASLPPNTGGGPPACLDLCCANPLPGTACDGGALDASCPSSLSCGNAASATLVLPFNVVCNGQTWVAVGGDCGDGGVADNGCPVSQPQNGAACTLDSGTSCQYGLRCSGTCDASSTAAGAGSPQTSDAASGSGVAGTGCASVAGKVGPAICSQGQWQTQSLGSCP